jgi:hypothetical protein
MRCGRCGAEIQSDRESNTQYGQRDGVTRSFRRLVGPILLPLFSSGWVVMALISEYWHARYIAEIHRVGFSQQTPEFFQMLDINYRFVSLSYFVSSCLWLTLVLFVWAWKLSAHMERTRLIAESLHKHVLPGNL